MNTIMRLYGCAAIVLACLAIDPSASARPAGSRDAVQSAAEALGGLERVRFPVMSQTEVIELVAGGVQRARQMCAEQLAKGNYFAGCPIFSDRY